MDQAARRNLDLRLLGRLHSWQEGEEARRQLPEASAARAARAGSGLNLNFNAKLAALEKRELTIGGFNVTAAANGGGSRQEIKLRVAANSRVAVGSGAKLAAVGAADVATLANGGNSNMFTAVANDGRSTMSGIVGSVTVGNVCVVSGYVTGI